MNSNNNATKISNKKTFISRGDVIRTTYTCTWKTHTHETKPHTQNIPIYNVVRVAVFPDILLYLSWCKILTERSYFKLLYYTKTQWALQTMLLKNMGSTFSTFTFFLNHTNITMQNWAARHFPFAILNCIRKRKTTKKWTDITEEMRFYNIASHGFVGVATTMCNKLYHGSVISPRMWSAHAPKPEVDEWVSVSSEALLGQRGLMLVF
jgi:hypothetical protein